MTTVYIDKKAGLVLTDSRITYTNKRYFLGLFPLKSEEVYGSTTQKSMYIHDRLFTAAGSVADINKVLDYLISGNPVIPSRRGNSHCILIDKNYCIHFIMINGEFKKYVEFTDNDYTFMIGSGSAFLQTTACFWLEGEERQEYIFEQFNKVHKRDPYSDDNIKVYRI